MATENDRIRQVRKTLGMTQEKFGEKIGMKKSSLSTTESGINAVSNQLRAAVCREFNVNESWLRTGEGEMFLSKSNEDLLMGFAESLTKIDDSDFKKKLVTAIAKMDDETWAAFKKLAYAFLEEFRDDSHTEK